MVLAALLVASVITITPVGQPAVNFDALTLDQQMGFVQTIRPQAPIVVPVQFSTGRVVVMPPSPLPPAQVDSLIRQHFQEADVALALRIAWCESRYDTNAKNPHSSASGLFQVMEGWWSGAWSSYPAFNPYDAEQNVKFAAWLFYNSGKQNWNPSRGCWG